MSSTKTTNDEFFAPMSAREKLCLAVVAPVIFAAAITCAATACLIRAGITLHELMKQKGDHGKETGH